MLEAATGCAAAEDAQVPKVYLFAFCQELRFHMVRAATRWVEQARRDEMPPGLAATLMRRALAVRPDQFPLRVRLGRALYRLRDLPDAIEMFEEAARLEPQAFTDWAALAHCYLQLKRPAEAISACIRGLAAQGESAVLCLRYGTALRKAGRQEEARVQFERCVALGDHQLFGLRELLRPLARNVDGGPLLEFCDCLPVRLRQTALVRANRAIALSRLGRVEETRALIDLERNVARMSMEPPEEFGTLEAFNEALAAEILRPSGDIAGERDFEIAYSPTTARRPALDALLRLVRGALEDYVAQGSRYGLDTALPPPPQTASLYHGFTVLRRDGSNGEHIHPEAYVSSVYYVRVPKSVALADDDRGMLTLGGCERYTAGYRASWGIRRLKPVAGSLFIFPSHIFHDVLPSLTDEPRISVAADMRFEGG